jgi:hypothetical protein
MRGCELLRNSNRFGLWYTGEAWGDREVSCTLHCQHTQLLEEGHVDSGIALVARSKEEERGRE